MENVTRTCYGAALQTSLLLGIPLVIPANSTLNEKLNIQAGVMFANNELPKMKYMSIGNGGHALTVGANGRPKITSTQHRTTDASLYTPLPFVLRQVNDDLSPLQRANYALRRVEDHDGVPYIAYYLKRLDYTNVTTSMQYTTVLDNVTTSTTFTPNNSNLNPVVPELSSTGVNVTTGDYVSVTAKFPFSLTAADVTEFENVCQIIYGDTGYDVISEMALCSAVDKIVSSDIGNNGLTFNYNEVIAAQVVAFISGGYIMSFANNGLNIDLDIGAVEPLFITTQTGV